MHFATVVFLNACLAQHTHSLSVCLPASFFINGVLPYAGTWNLIFWLRNTYIGTIPNVLGEDFEGNALRIVLLFL